MLDALDPGFETPAHRLGRIGMRGDIGAPVIRRLNGCQDLVKGVLRHIQRIIGRRRATSGQEFDLRCPGAQVLSHRGQDLVAAIGNERHAQKFTDQRLAAEPARPFGQRPEVAVAGVCEIIAPLG